MQKRIVALCLLMFVLIAVAALAQEEKASRPSPAAQAQCQFADGKTIRVDYSSPRAKGRKIFGGLVPYGEVWRTGANEATTLKTEGDLDLIGTTVPAGTYTLFTIPKPDKWTLIISKKTGEPGIPYPGEKEDFARVEMKVEHLSQIVDPFTITLEPPRPSQLLTLGVGGPTPARLCLAWENTKACINLNAK